MKSLLVGLAVVGILISCIPISDAKSLDGTLELGYGNGEFANKYQAKEVEAKLMLNYKFFQVGLRHEYRTSEAGAIDSASASLIQSDYTSACLGVQSTRGTAMVGCVNSDWWDVEVKHKGEPLRWGFYPIVGLYHSNSFKHKRKTTGSIIGVGNTLDPKWAVEATIDIANNTQQKVNDKFFVNAIYKF